MIPLWYHIGTCIALVASNAFTAWWGMRRVKELREALHAKAVLTGTGDMDTWDAVAVAAGRMEFR